MHLDDVKARLQDKLLAEVQESNEQLDECKREIFQFQRDLEEALVAVEEAKVAAMNLRVRVQQCHRKGDSPQPTCADAPAWAAPSPLKYL
jgi:hypothetical protein